MLFRIRLPEFQAEYTCSVCSDSYKDDYVDALGHSYGEWIERTAPTCTKTGVDYRVCAVCDFEETRKSDALGHDYSEEWTVDKKETCTKDGSKSHHCSRCDSKSDVTAIPATGHSYVSATTDPTCTEKGYTTYTCSVCSSGYTGDFVDAPGHSYGEWIERTAPTCTKTGVDYRACAVCELEETRVSDALGHDIVEGEHVEQQGENDGYTPFACSRCDYSYTVLDPAVAIENLVALPEVYNISLSWLKAKEASVTGYEIYRKAETEEEFTLLAKITKRNTVSYTDENLAPEIEYSYKIRALKGDVTGVFSEIATAAALADTEAPQVTKITPDDYSTLNKTFSVAATANDNIAVVRFELLYSKDDGATWEKLGEKAGATCTIFVNSIDIPDGEYKFKVIAYDEAGNCGESFVRNYKIDNTGPEKVSGIKTVAVYSSKATLSWNKVSDSDCKSFILQKKTDNGFINVATGITTLGYNLSGLEAKTSYTYRVAAVDVLGNVGEYSDEYTFTTLEDTEIPVITKILPLPGRYSKTIPLSFIAKDDCKISKIYIYKSTDLENWTEITSKNYSVGATVNDTINIDIESYDEGSIYLHVVAVDEAGNRSISDNETACVEYYVDKTAPAKVTGLSTAATQDGYIELSWKQGTDSDIASYNVYRAESESGEFKKIASNLKTVNHFDRSVKEDIVYYYKVSAVDKAGNEGILSDAVSATASTDITAPEITKITPATNSYVSDSLCTVSVLAQDNRRLSSVTVEYKTDSMTAFKVLTTKTDINNYYYVLKSDLNISALSEGEKVYVRAICTDKTGLSSGYSDAVCYVVNKTAPVLNNLTATEESGKVILSWKDGREDDLAGFNVYRSTNSASYVGLRSFTANASGEYTFTETLSPASYKYRIDAIDKYGNTKSYYSEDIVVEEMFELTPVITSESAMEETVQETFSAKGTVSTYDIASYKWDFGDETSAEGESTVKSYQKSGTYTVTLTVTDIEGNTASVQKSMNVTKRNMLGSVKIKVTDENGTKLSGMPVYIDFGGENQHSVNTGSDGTVTVKLPVGQQEVATYKNGYLPDSAVVYVKAGETQEIELTAVKQDLITGDFKVHEMTLDEIKAAGIDIHDAANLQIYEAEVTLIYGEEKYEVTYYRDDDGIIEWNYKFISKDYTDDDDDDDDDDDHTGGGGGSYIPKPYYVPNDEGEEIIAVLWLPLRASYLKQFFSATLTITNNATSEFVIADCDADISVPNGLTVVKHSPISGAIQGGSSSSANWILRGDKAGTYNLSASFNGILEKFNVPVSATFEADNPITVYGPETVKLRVEVNDEIRNGIFYFNVGLVNQRPVDVNCPTINTVEFVTNITEAYKNNKELTDDDNYEAELVGIRVDNADGTSSYYEAESKDADLAKILDTLPPGTGLFYEYVVYDLVDNDEIAYFNEAVIECGGDYYDSIEVVSVAMDKFSDNSNSQILDKQNSLVIIPRNMQTFLSGGSDGKEDYQLNWTLEKVTLKIGNDKYNQTDEKNFILKKEQITDDLILSRTDYYDYVIPKDVALAFFDNENGDPKEYIAYMTKDKKDGKPYISSVFVRQKNSNKEYIDVQKQELIPMEDELYDIFIVVENLNEKATYYISQDQSHKISSDSSIFTTSELSSALAPKIS